MASSPRDGLPQVKTRVAAGFNLNSSISDSPFDGSG